MGDSVDINYHDKYAKSNKLAVALSILLKGFYSDYKDVSLGWGKAALESFLVL